MAKLDALVKNKRLSEQVWVTRLTSLCPARQKDRLSSPQLFLWLFFIFRYIYLLERDSTVSRRAAV